MPLNLYPSVIIQYSGTKAIVPALIRTSSKATSGEQEKPQEAKKGMLGLLYQRVIDELFSSYKPYT